MQQQNEETSAVQYSDEAIQKLKDRRIELLRDLNAITEKIVEIEGPKQNEKPWAYTDASHLPPALIVVMSYHFPADNFTDEHCLKLGNCMVDWSRQILDQERSQNNGSDFRSRLLKEKEQLDNRMTKLADFVNSDKSDSLSENQRKLLEIQYKAMSTYSETLAERIKDLGIEA